MGALEALAGELACANASDDDIAGMRSMHNNMVEHFRNQDPVAYIKLNRDIHNKFFEFAANPSLSAMYQSLMIRITVSATSPKSRPSAGNRRSRTISA